MKILAVDDDESICSLLREAVAAKTGHTIVTVPSGPDAIRAISKAKVPFDCFLLDIQMPVIDGITLAAKIRKTKGYARTPIIMLTAMSQKKYVDAAFAAGATDFVTKPFDFLELFSRIALAQRIVSEQRRISETSSEMASLKKDLLQNTSHSLHEPIELVGVTQVAGYVAFENHLLSLSRAQLMRTSGFAMKIDTIQSAFSTLPPISFRRMLTDVSSELMSVVADNEAIATYRGNGLFLCLFPRTKRFSSHRLEMELNERLTYVPSTQVDGLQSKVSVGEAHALRALTRAGAVLSLQRAINSVETRSASHRSRTGLAQLRKAARLHPGSGFQNEMERRAYEHLLEDALREDGNRRSPAFG